MQYVTPAVQVGRVETCLTLGGKIEWVIWWNLWITPFPQIYPIAWNRFVDSFQIKPTFVSAVRNSFCLQIEKAIQFLTLYAAINTEWWFVIHIFIAKFILVCCRTCVVILQISVFVPEDKSMIRTHIKTTTSHVTNLH